MVLLALLATVIVAVAVIHILRSRNAGHQYASRHKPSTRPDVQSSRYTKPGTKDRYEAEETKTRLYKDMYNKVQNLEFHPEILPKARQTLCALLREGLEIERSRVRQQSILDIRTYCAESLQKFLSDEHNEVTAQWQEYVHRRNEGGQPELFQSRETAIAWVKKQAPAKLVDGAWLGHVHKVSTPFSLRTVTKGAWQVLSEELGDGDLEKNHVFLYANLLDQIGVKVPSSCDADFVDPRYGMGDDLIWKAATAQLLVSLFPHDFLPEVLGFNMHFELLTMETLKAARELPEFGISGYYFLLHVSIDNADSGHTAMALGTVTKYLEIVRKSDPSAVPEVWRRIQAGYILSRTSSERRQLSGQERRLTDMLRLKANASHQIHCASRVIIGNQTLADWLSPTSWSDTEDRRRDFLNALANAKPWIIRGNSDKSLLLRELAWNGRMFGAFTNTEVEDVRRWVNGLENGDMTETDHHDRYISEVCGDWKREEKGEHDSDYKNLCQDHTLPSLYPSSSTGNYEQTSTETFAQGLQQPLDLESSDLDSLLLLWFVHPCLLEDMVSVPYRTATPLASHIIRILRAELGYLEEGSGPAGMDEHIRCASAPDLVSLGLEINERLGRPPPADIHDVFEACSSEMTQATAFATAIRAYAVRPIQNDAMLLGLTLSFLDFETAVAKHQSLLSMAGRQALSHIINRKRAAIGDCLKALGENGAKYDECMQYYLIGRSQIVHALQTRGQEV